MTFSDLFGIDRNKEINIVNGSLYYFGEKQSENDLLKLICSYNEKNDELNSNIVSRFLFKNHCDFLETLTVDQILKINNSGILLWYCLAVEIDEKSMTKACEWVAANCDAETIFLFANDVSRCDKEILQEAIISRGDPKYIFEFAFNIEGSDISKLESALIEECKSKNTIAQIPLFAQMIKEADKKELEDEMVKIYSRMETQEKFRDAKYLFSFSRAIEDADTHAINRYLSESFNFEYIAYQTVLVDPSHLLENIFGTYNELSSFTASYPKIFRNKHIFEEYSKKLIVLNYEENIKKR